MPIGGGLFGSPPGPPFSGQGRLASQARAQALVWRSRGRPCDGYPDDDDLCDYSEELDDYDDDWY